MFELRDEVLHDLFFQHLDRLVYFFLVLFILWEFTSLLKWLKKTIRGKYYTPKQVLENQWNGFKLRSNKTWSRRIAWTRHFCRVTSLLRVTKKMRKTIFWCKPLRGAWTGNQTHGSFNMDSCNYCNACPTFDFLLQNWYFQRKLVSLQFGLPKP